MKVIISCCGGNTSNVLAAKLRKHIEDQGKEIKVKACSESNIEKHLEEGDILLVAPQIYISPQRIANIEQTYHAKVLFLSFEIYGSMDAEKAYELFSSLKTKKTRPQMQNEFLSRLLVFNNLPVFKQIQRAFWGLFIPMTLGSLATLLLNLPLGDSYRNIVEMPFINDTFLLIIWLTIHSSALYLTLSWGYTYGTYARKQRYLHALSCLMFFVCMMPNDFLQKYEYYFGMQAIFSALAISVIVTSSLSFLKYSSMRWKWKISKRIQYVIWACIMCILLSICKYFIEEYGFTSLSDILSSLIRMPLDNLTGNWNIYLALTFVSGSLWFFGIHGGMITYTLFMGVYTQARYANFSAYIAGVNPPYPMYSLFLWTSIGGTGCTLALNLWMLKAKSKKLRDNGKTALLTSICNMNEPIIFGAPIVFNFILYIPFLIVPFINLAITYVSIFVLGIVQIPTGNIDSIGFFIPFGLNALISTQSVTGLLLSLALLLVDMFLWYPFFKKYDDSLYLLENKECHNLK